MCTYTVLLPLLLSDTFKESGFVMVKENTGASVNQMHLSLRSNKASL